MASIHAEDARKPLDEPNILFIFADDWGWGDMSLHKSPHLRTPNLDNLFSQGTEFYQFHVNSPCCVSRHSGLLCTRTRQAGSRYSLFLILPHILLCTRQSISAVSGLSNLSWMVALPWITSGK